MTTSSIITWRKSSYSNGLGGCCVEIAQLGRACAVRDSKDPNGPALTCTAAQWSAFVTRLCAGEFGC